MVIRIMLAWPPIPSFIVWLTISSHPAKKQRDFARKHKVFILIRGTLFFAKREKQKKSKDIILGMAPVLALWKPELQLRSMLAFPEARCLKHHHNHILKNYMIPIYLSFLVIFCRIQSDHGLSLALTNYITNSLLLLRLEFGGSG